MALGADGHRRILIVDDNRDVRDVLVELLTGVGYQVTAAANGQEAFTLLRQQPLPHLILANLMMPVMNGWVFLGQLKQDPRLAAIPVVVLSAMPDLASQAPCLDASAYLHKPVDIEDLLETLARHCP
jgi:CheY-like chemotaxis protein